MEDFINECVDKSISQSLSRIKGNRQYILSVDFVDELIKLHVSRRTNFNNKVVDFKFSLELVYHKFSLSSIKKQFVNYVYDVDQIHFNSVLLNIFK